VSPSEWSWLLAALELLGLWLAKKRPIVGFTLNLATEPLWTAYAIITGQWGFVLSAAAYVVVYGRLLWQARNEMGYNERDKERVAVWVAAHLPRRVRAHVIGSRQQLTEVRISAPNGTVFEWPSP
jgi:hypothetical protein